ncbi:hypothetical protein SNOG_04887 [Parastagonospora nodorum SN15]|uniref:NmrA-like domain-containing protein n=1 Tax=Phaeosphaeria nodorum (strain SN15 / ATCC MYA-4574 / FGSC 10173) TaxID=321614 RepID=Q0UTM7_PHANO|nr:hypothetical protein SNOG_04887 [Parastagonospora nodorum SN15]EAT87278.1 hypothetical protein SNOG_04887 [Parastagonospora nodorum SN15]
MVKIAVVGGTGNVAKNLLHAPIRSGKHEITIFTRSGTPSNPIPGLTYQKVDYQDLPGLTNTLKGFHTCLSFLIAHQDVNNTVQKESYPRMHRRRRAPLRSLRMGTNQQLPASGHQLGGLEYCLFQPSVFMDYFAHPHSLTPGLFTWTFFVDLENRRAMILDDGEIPVVITAISDISEVLALALDDPRPWPVIGGIQGAKTTSNEILALGKKIRGGEWSVEYVKSEDVQRGELKTSWVPVFDHPIIPVESREEFSKTFVIEFFVAMGRGAWGVSDEFNKRFPEYKFTGVEEYLSKAWEGKA